jgi:hypothetical protein
MKVLSVTLAVVLSCSALMADRHRAARKAFTAVANVSTITAIIVPGPLCAALIEHPLVGWLVANTGYPEYASDHFAISPVVGTTVQLPQAGSYEFIVRYGAYPAEIYKGWNSAVFINDGFQIALPCE